MSVTALTVKALISRHSDTHHQQASLHHGHHLRWCVDHELRLRPTAHQMKPSPQLISTFLASPHPHSTLQLINATAQVKRAAGAAREAASQLSYPLHGGWALDVLASLLQFFPSVFWFFFLFCYVFASHFHSRFMFALCHSASTKRCCFISLSVGHHSVRWLVTPFDGSNFFRLYHCGTTTVCLF